MPWLSIIMAILSFLGSLKKDKSNVGRAALTGAAVGLGTYYVTHETEWGRENLGALDGVVTGELNPTPPTMPASSPNPGTAVLPAPIPGSTTQVGSATGGIWKSVVDNLVPIGAGAAAGAVLTGGTSGKWLPWIIGGVALVFLLK